MNTSCSSIRLVAALAILLLPVAYVECYVILVHPGRASHGTDFRIISNYASDSDWDDYVFWPLEQVHRRLLPAQWDGVEPSKYVRPPNLPLKRGKASP
ncbi:hypothetical protein ETAA8_01830 [Anatilimnocola aggregata]|uniref:Uncharacterized protein n=1 Tax=Anatilimnocola aggregata TaxID=2528021 RepID=A0A517Y4S7_9BACT|nr:hypothetical protein [Anatilimnocola aggregata]QDU25122.1 hypothetical protein ETAA8_01830 [Anatilimnocola aggregata]